MITFLPYEDFDQSAACLDRARLGNQRSEVRGILRAINFGSKRWGDTPMVNMWRGHERILMFYGLAICDEWYRRGYTENLKGDIIDLAQPWWGKDYPWWLGNATFHESHQSNLIRKKPEFYRPLWPDVPDNLKYKWPV